MTMAFGAGNLGLDLGRGKARIGGKDISIMLDLRTIAM